MMSEKIVRWREFFVKHKTGVENGRFLFFNFSILHVSAYTWLSSVDFTMSRHVRLMLNLVSYNTNLEIVVKLWTTRLLTIALERCIQSFISYLYLRILA